jgi:uncharacterized membrane protein HdeD (DUF308 family)
MALFLRNPAESVVTLTLLVIVFLMVEGISKIIFSLTIRFHSGGSQPGGSVPAASWERPG